MNPPHEFKVMRVRECLAEPALIDTPERAVEYWHANIATADWFDPAKEAFVVVVVNTRRRIIGHNLVTLGTLDTCQVHAREVFRPVIVAAGGAALLAHNLCVSAHKLCYVTPRLMCGQPSAALTLTRDLRRKEWCAGN